MQTTYNAGREALNRHIKRGGDQKRDFSVVKTACNNEGWHAIWSGIWWFIFLTSCIAPSIVLWMNPRKTLTVSKPTVDSDKDQQSTTFN